MCHHQKRKKLHFVQRLRIKSHTHVCSASPRVRCLNDSLSSSFFPDACNVVVSIILFNTFLMGITYPKRYKMLILGFRLKLFFPKFPSYHQTSNTNLNESWLARERTLDEIISESVHGELTTVNPCPVLCSVLGLKEPFEPMLAKRRSLRL